MMYEVKREKKKINETSAKVKRVNSTGAASDHAYVHTIGPINSLAK